MLDQLSIFVVLDAFFLITYRFSSLPQKARHWLV